MHGLYNPFPPVNAALKAGTGISASIHKAPSVTVGAQFPLHNVRIYTFHGKNTETDSISRAHLQCDSYGDHMC